MNGQTDLINEIKRTDYPQLVMHLDRLYHNARTVIDDCGAMGIKVCGVIKGYNGIVEGSSQLLSAGAIQLGTSRMEQIIENRQNGIDAEFLLVRVPMISEAEEVAAYADLSLESELAVVEAINEACGRLGRRHGVILMADLGDLREGFWDKDQLVEVAGYIEEKLEYIDLKGVGTNLGCYGSIVPTVDKMEELIAVAERVEERIGRTLEFISGGATTSYPLVLNKTMPERINHLRIGEGIISAYDLDEMWHLDMSRLHQDVFTLRAEVIEVKVKPTHPVGEIFVDCFGAVPTYEDRGMRKRALIGLGRLDYAINDKIFVKLPGAFVVGSSSDHTILDVEDCAEEVKVGDIIEFDLSYPSVLYLTGNRYVKRVIE